MAIKHAEDFIREITTNTELRKSMYCYDSSAEIMASIRNQGFIFKLYEFEESINHLKTESPNEEQAIMLDELLLWWNMLMYDGSIVDEGPALCSPAKCSSCSSCG